MSERQDDQPTQRLRGAPPASPTAPLPGPLDLTSAADGDHPADAQPSDLGWPQDPDEAETGVLRLDEIFDGPAAPAAATSARAAPAAPAAPAPEPSATPAPPAAPASAETPTWTAMPVVPISSDPVGPGPTPDRASPPARHRQRSELATRIRADAATAVRGAARETQAWLRVQDNFLMVMTALVGIMLIIVVSLLGH